MDENTRMMTTKKYRTISSRIACIYNIRVLVCSVSYGVGKAREASEGSEGYGRAIVL